MSLPFVARAEEPPAPPPVKTEPATEAESTSVPAVDDTLVPEAAEAPVEDPKPRWRFLIEGSVGAMYDSNIFTQPHDEEEDLVFSIAPVASLIYGDFRKTEGSFLLLTYTPTARFFLDHASENSVDHDALFEVRAASGKLSADLKVRFQALTDSEVDVGTRTTRYVYSAALGLHYDFTGQSSGDVDFFFTAFDYETRLDSQESLVKTWLNYQITPKINSGFGFGAGYLEPDGSGSQTYEQVMARARYTVTSKIELRAEAGVEFRQLEEDDRATPLWLVAASYDPSEGTSFSLEYSRKVRASAALAGRNYEANSAVLKIRQRLFTKYALALRAGYTNADYYISDFSRPSDREDDYYFIRPSFEYVANKWLKIEVFYQFRENDSNTDRFAFATHQVGFQASFAF